MDFNEIKDTWKNSYENKRLNKKQIEARLSINARSNTILAIITRNHIFGMLALIAVYSVAVLLLFIYVNSTLFYILLFTITLLMGIAFYVSFKNYKTIKYSIRTDENIRLRLEKTIKIMEKSLRFGMGNFYKYILIPISLIIGVTIGILIASGDKTFLETIYQLETKSIIKISFVIVLGSIITIIFSQFTMKNMYKDHYESLKICLQDLEEENI
jgi:hypothetical protein